MSSVSGAVDGAGDSDGKTIKIHCSRCITENEIEMGDVQYTSIHSFIVCKSCEEEIILEDDWADPATTSESMSDGTTLLEQTESADRGDGGGQEEGVEHPVGLRQKGRDRKLKSSASFTQCGSERKDPTTIPQSTSLGTIAQNGSELTEDSLRQLSRIIQNQPCPNCGCTDRNLLNRVEGINDLFHCFSCNIPYGIDDGMNFFDFQDFLDTGFRMEPCSVCGNDDPEKFTLERRSGAGGAEPNTDLVVRCSVCEPVSLSGMEQLVEGNEEVMCAVRCSCGNMDSQKFEDQLDACSRTVETVCMVCKKRIATKVSGKVCSCRNASVDYAFDEVGYINMIKCNACGAVMDVKDDDDARKKASSDGTSRGRTRIRSLDMIRSGDHIAWHQSLGYWHHAIVIEVQFSVVNLVHYNGPSAHKGEIVDEWKELDLTKEEVYRIDYDRDTRTYDPDAVVKRARSRLGEHSYNLMTNNCEHFARWCVTGQHRSVQVQTFWDSVVNRVKVATQGEAVKSLSKQGIGLVKRGVATGGVTKSATLGMRVTNGLVAGYAVGYEIYSVMTDIRQAHRQRVEGAIDRNEFLKITIKRSCEGFGSLVGTAVTLAIPLTSHTVGLTIGSIIGKAAGAMVGRNAALLIDKASSKKS